MKKKENCKIWRYVNERNEDCSVFCTRLEYLYLKMCYSKNGLTDDEYRELKRG